MTVMVKSCSQVCSWSKSHVFWWFNGMFCLKIRLPHGVFFAKFDGLCGLPSCSPTIFQLLGSSAKIPVNPHRSVMWCSGLGQIDLCQMVNKHVDTLNKPRPQSQQSVWKASEKPGLSGRNPIECLLLHVQHLYLRSKSLAKVNHQTACLLLKSHLCWPNSPFGCFNQPFSKS